MRHNRRDDGQLSCRKREMKTMNANTALDGHTTVIKMAERGGVPLKSRPVYPRQSNPRRSKPERCTRAYYGVDDFYAARQDSRFRPATA